MYSRKMNSSQSREYPYSIPPRYSGNRFRRSDGRPDDPIAEVIPPPDETCDGVEHFTDSRDDCAEACADKPSSESCTYPPDQSESDSCGGEKKRFDLSGLFKDVGGEELLLIGLIILLCGENAKAESESDVIALLALLLLLR